MSDELLIGLLDEAVGEPPNAIEPEAVLRLGRVRRRRRRAVVGGVTALVVAAVLLLPYAIVNADRRTPSGPPAALSALPICATAPPATKAEPLPTGIAVTTVIRCDSKIVKRPGDGLWLQASELRATVAARAYGRVIESPGGGLKCPKGVHPTTFAGGNVVPDLVADAAGHLYRASITVCDTDVSVVEAAAEALVWQTIASEWTVRMLSEANTSSVCGTWWATNPNGLGNHLTAQPTRLTPPLPWQRFVFFEASRRATDVFCINRSSGPAGPMPDDLLQAKRLTGTQKDDVLRVMSRIPGVASDTTRASFPHLKPGQTCTTPPSNAWSVTSDGTLIGYVGSDNCARTLAPDLTSASPDLLGVAERLGMVDS